MTSKATKTIKVAQVLAGAPKGGAENFYTRMVSELAKEPSVEQHAFTRPHPQREAAFVHAGVPVSTYKFGSGLHWLDRLNYRNALKATKPDIVVTYMNRATSLTPKGDYKLVARLGHYYDLKYYRHCDYWIGNTKDICAYLISEGLPQEKIVFLPNFIDEERSAPLEKHSFGTSSDAQIIFALGRLHINKGFDVLIRALEKLNSNVVLWLAGDGPERNNLENLIKSLKLEQRVKLLGWRNDVSALMATADIFVCPSRHEGIGNIILEAWFHKCPMIATASQGPAELITHDENALLTPIDDVEHLTTAIEYLLSHPHKALCLAEQGYQEYNTHYSRDRIIEQYMTFFESIV